MRLGRFRANLALVALVTLAACTQSTSNTQSTGHTQSSASTGPAESTGLAASTGDPSGSADGVVVGVAVPGSKVAEVTKIEGVIDSRFGLVRLFARWDDPTPNLELAALVEAGYQVHYSIRPRTNQGVPVLWADLATAEPGTSVYGQMVNWADQLVQLPPGSYVTINHEPETKDSSANGEAEDFIAMWRRFAALLDERGGEHLSLVWTMTGGSFRSGTAGTWYPGDDVVDVVGADLYNWFTCQGTNREWRSFERLLEAPLAFAREQGKPLAVPEVASAEDLTVEGRKAEWLDEAADFLQTPGLENELLYVAWFDVTAPGGVFPNCVWDYDSSPSSAAAFARLVNSLGAG